MSKIRGKLEVSNEDMVARLTTAAYGVALRHGLRGSFLDAQLEIWEVLRNILHGEPFERDDPAVQEPVSSVARTRPDVR